MKFKFGDRVRVTGILERKCRSKNVRPHGGDLYKYWQAKPIPVKEGILIGYRTLPDGVREWVCDEEGYIFIPKEHYRVALVVFNERQNPVYVLLGDLREPL